MKRWLAMGAVFLLTLLCACAAAEEGSLRHLVYGDVSVMTMDEAQADSASGNEAGLAEIGTDVYLFVNPDTASNVTFEVVDEDGQPIAGAQIYVIYAGERELLDVTDEKGQQSLFLFRDVTYGYNVLHTDYESVEGQVLITGETQIVRVVMRQLRTLSVHVVDRVTPLVNVRVTVDGQTYITDDNGDISAQVYNGDYFMTVVSPEGQIVKLVVHVKGDTHIEVDMHQESTSRTSGTASTEERASGPFLVYNRDYDPEDYTLVAYHFDASDLTQEPEETQEEFDARVSRYLEQYVNTISVQAQPEHEQHDSAPDTNVFVDGELLYTQRSLMPMGDLLRTFETHGYEQVVFSNEDIGVRLNLASLHNEEISKVFALVNALENGEPLESLLTEQARSRGLAQAGLDGLNADALDITQLDLSVLRTAVFRFDRDEDTPEDAVLLSNSLYTEALFELRITPILQEAMVDMVFSELGQSDSDVLLTNVAYMEAEVARRASEGYLTQQESDRLYAYLVDGQLDDEELEQLQAMYDADQLDSDTVELLIAAALEQRLYRVQLFVIIGDAHVNITSAVDMSVLFEANSMLSDQRDAQMLAEQTSLLRVANQGEETQAQLVENMDVLRVSANYEEEFAQVLNRKRFVRYMADVRHERATQSALRYYIVFDQDQARLPEHSAYYLMTSSAVSGLYTVAANAVSDVYQVALAAMLETK